MKAQVCGAALAVGIGVVALAGCGSDATPAPTTAASSSTTSSSSSAPPTTTTQAADAAANISAYLKSAGVTETPVKKGDPGAPTIELPIPAGWADAGAATPPDAWQTVIFADPAAAADPAKITATVARLTGGTINATTILEHAPNDLRSLPDFVDLSPGQTDELGGYPAQQFGGSYTKDGVARLIGQKTLVVPAGDGNGSFLIKIIADANEEQFGPLADATSAIDEQTKITP